MKTKHSGKINGTKELGISAEDAAAAASGALKGASEGSSSALTTVREAFTQIIHGAKVLAREPKPALFSNN